MRQILILFTIICLVLGGHNIRHQKKSIGYTQKALVQTSDVQYIDDDVTFIENKEPEQEVQPVVQPEAESDFLITNNESDQLDLEEQKKYEESRKQQLAQTVGSDVDSYMSNLNVEVQDQSQQDQMPVDVVEHELNPQIPKYTIPNSRDVDQVNEVLLMNEEPEYEIRETHLQEGEIYADQVEEVMRKIEEKEQIEYAALAAQGPR